VVAATVAGSALILGSLRGPVQPPSGRLFYVGPSGSDSNSGTSLGAPFRTISACAAVATAGDTCLIRTGTYHETVTPAHDGTPTQPITFKPYGTDNVTIDGADPITGWIPAYGNVYTASVALPISGTPTGDMANQVFLDGQMAHEAQWPTLPITDTSPLSLTFSRMAAGTTTTPEGTTALTVIADPALPITTTNLVGALVHYWGGLSWWSSTGLVTAQGLLGAVGSTPAITFTPSAPVADAAQVGAQAGSRYYLEGTLALLDGPDEWAYAPITQTLFLWTPQGDSPAGHIVQAKQRRWALDLSGRSNVTVASLSIQAAGITTTATSAHDTLDGLMVTYPTHLTALIQGAQSGRDDSGVVLAGPHDLLQDSTVAESAGPDVSMAGQGDVVVNNLLRDAVYAGSQAGIATVDGPGDTLLRNTLWGSASNGIMAAAGVSGSPRHIASNDLWGYDLYQADGGGLYVCCDGDAGGSRIDHNWVHDTRVPSAAVVGNNGAYAGAGIYPDVGSYGWTIDHNVLWNPGGAAIQDNGSVATPVLSNLLIANNTIGSTTIGPLAHVAAIGTHNVRYLNNLFLGPLAASPAYLPGATTTTDLVAGGTAVVNAAGHDDRLPFGSPAIDAGTALPGITDGYVGPAPDVGAYEYGAPAWDAGCTLAACQGIDPAIPPFVYSPGP